MREFELWDWSQVQNGKLVLMTCNILSPREKMKIADFRDSEALKFRKSGNWMGMSIDRGLRLGSGPLSMVNGVWFCNEDHKACNLYVDQELSPELLSLENIE